MSRRVCLSLFAAVVLILPSNAFGQEPVASKPKPPPSATKQESALEQERLARQFQDFEAALLQMAQRLERSSKREDRERAVTLKEALKKAHDENLNTKFETLITLLRSNNAVSLSEVKDAMDQSKMLADDIRVILALLLNDHRDAELKAERERIRKLMEAIDKAIREQKLARAETEAGRMGKGELSKSQEKVTKSTEDIAKAMGKEGKDSEGKGGKGQKSQGNQGQGKEGKESENKSGQQQSQQKQDQQMPGRKQVQDAVGHQKKAENNIQKDKKDEASNEQDKAIQKLEEARKKLEEILRQLREEERQRLLADLQARCERMLAMQIEVYEGTVSTEKAIGQNADQKPSRAEEQRSLQLSDREQDLVRQANQAIQLLASATLENGASAVAFPEVFSEVRDDMQHVARRLGKADVSADTQVIEKDIIGLLKEMIEALKKAQANKGNQSNGQSGEGSQSNQNLIDILAELKMIKSLQIRVNSRTKTYAHRYQGEQASDPDIQKEMENLAQRQLKIFEITNNIARGKNQ